MQDIRNPKKMVLVLFKVIDLGTFHNTLLYIDAILDTIAVKYKFTSVFRLKYIYSSYNTCNSRRTFFILENVNGIKYINWVVVYIL